MKCITKNISICTKYVPHPYITVIKPKKCTCIRYVFSHIINYQHVSITFVIIFRVSLQEQSEHNRLQNYISGTIQRFNIEWFHLYILYMCLHWFYYITLNRSICVGMSPISWIQICIQIYSATITNNHVLLRLQAP
jgi:hypothetical protein